MKVWDIESDNIKEVKSNKTNVSDEIIDEYIKSNNSLTKEELTKQVVVRYIPSMKQLFRVMRKNKHFIDSRDKDIISLIRETYSLKNEKGYDTEKRLSYFGLVKDLGVGSEVDCDYEDYGHGVVVKMYSSDLMAVQFDDRPYTTMCNSKTMTTVHDAVKRKLNCL